MPQSQQSHRKDEHVSLAEKYYHGDQPNSFDQVRIRHDALPETAVADVNLRTTIGQWHWDSPLYIEAMTGGSPHTGELNARLGKIAAACGLPIATGSQSVAIKDPQLADTFSSMRTNNPDGLIFGNLGAGHPLAAAQTAIKMLQADALELHLNVVQEIVMPEGDRDFHWLANIQTLVQALPVPVIVKEVGFGISKPTMQQLYQAGVRYIDLGGHGGTNFVDIENRRRPQRDMAYLHDFGLTTVESLLSVQGHPQDLTIFAAGGIRQPLDVLKALLLGADAVGMAGTVLHALLHHTDEEVIAMLTDWQSQLKRLLALVGATSIADLHQMGDKILLSPELVNYKQTL
ncbi:type 2 isopentenyl-diphosphate Delta-isomerase [Lactiplantibacillus pentosus]|uniref:type 2 isopentenyl-diphosphate Delta-isomerase n=1 Tax=Lactiplantibacillus pentosus TaxID=1589 RepID=UPI000EA96D09|nr:type 2 isopentenyl-diphosphate Delta-isomerase [Lactiplantibacillus pentosus]AYG37365.1 type 2 isopentenyl-diphosphate Delta-isomerase [Lactiplantibacillus pentosus]AYG40021.1 type 2 isopentenyl-diphosphate Delta-isomerase [Lactiplantibacillus pentosus]MCJ8179730.1 type 2 isopentenyl-diphosphate Delta-isomerase [Lactiplantibacillus pentosus]